jgi:hypothetical protein
MDRVFELDWHFIKDVEVKELIYNFRLFFQTIMLKGLQVMLDFKVINQNFKLSTRRMVVPTKDLYNEKFSLYHEGGRDEHYKQDSSYILNKVVTNQMETHLTSLIKVGMFKQGDKLVPKTLLLSIKTIERR